MNISHRLIHCVSYISIHVSARERTLHSHCYLRLLRFQFTSPQGDERVSWSSSSSLEDISIHIPLRGWTCKWCIENILIQISIHIPLRGWTLCRRMSHRSVDISIHIPLRGWTSPGTFCSSSQIFQFTSPQGDEPDHSIILLRLFSISTHVSVRRRTSFGVNKLKSIDISTHVSVRRRTFWPWGKTEKSQNFNSRLPKETNTIAILCNTCLQNFNSRLRKETNISASIILALPKLISIHVSARRRT